METGQSHIITQKGLRKHNFFCGCRSLLFLGGALAVVLILMVLGWCVWGIMTGELAFGTLSWKGVLFMSIFAILVLRWGYRKMDLEKQSLWERFQTHEAVDPGVRISRKMAENGLVFGSGLRVYAMLAPRWFFRGISEWSAKIPANQEKAESLEEVRRHLAARETWEPIHEFQHHEKALQELAHLEMVSIREYVDVWYVRISLAGQREHDLVGDVEEI